MSSSTYKGFFKAATGIKQGPYGYQCRLACGERRKNETDADWLSRGTSCESRLIDIPTGLGKTAAVILAWLWNRVHLRKPEWPRRLVYCLPMRTLVEQTEKEVRTWLLRLARRHTKPRDGSQLRWLALHSPIILMGGEELTKTKREWDIHPERPSILIGTQDMLLSRALNRGYGMSRYRWPMHFGLLNNDCLWVMDETQLMGPGLGTACQLEAFRASKETSLNGHGSFGAAGSVTWYMSATSNPEHLKTREWRTVARLPEFEFGLSTEEKALNTGPIHQRRFAVKQLELKPALGFEDSNSSKSLVSDIRIRHEALMAAIGSDLKLPARTMIICNTVDRAVEVYGLLAPERRDGCDRLLLHSRFRPPERRAQMRRLTSPDRAVFPKGQIVVATQVIEAGLDVSSGVLWSEVAPLASLVQRLGRLNRAGEFNGSSWKPVAMIVGVGVVEAAPSRETKDEAKKREDKNVGRCLPYEPRACKTAWESLRKLGGDASPANLDQIHDDIVASIPRCRYSLQRHELIDFFDTDANLSLGFTDVSPFVRGLDDDTDLQVCWREKWPREDGGEGTDKPKFTPDFQRDELCSVPISKTRKAHDILNRGWLWRGNESGWISVRDGGIAPGMTILLPLDAGGYDSAAGWTGDKADNKHFSRYQPPETSSDEEQLSCLSSGWQSISVHTGEVARELNELPRDLLAANGYETARAALPNAVAWHDVGKNHPRWQRAVVAAFEKAGITGKEAHEPFAKFSLSDSPSLAENGKQLEGDALKKRIRELRNSFRPGIAHEVASALAFRAHEQTRLGPARDTDLASLLAEYVIMSHHGRVRKVLRDEIPKTPKVEKDCNSVRGVSEGDPLPAVVIDDRILGCERLSTDCRRMGRPFTPPDAFGHESYTCGVLRLLEHFGPFRLAYFEALFRAADCRASARAAVTTTADNPSRAASIVMRESPTPYGIGDDPGKARLEPWSHPWHDELGLLYHLAMAEKIRRRPGLLEVAKENIRRWIAAEPQTQPSRARLEWLEILQSKSVQEILEIMTDPSQEGHRRRQSTPFAGILTDQEAERIRDELLTATSQ